MPNRRRRQRRSRRSRPRSSQNQLTVSTAIKMSPNGIVGIKTSTLEIPTDRSIRVISIKTSIASEQGPSVYQVAITDPDKALIGCSVPCIIGINSRTLTYRPPFITPSRYPDPASTFISCINRGKYTLHAVITLKIWLSENYDLKAITAQTIETSLSEGLAELGIQ